VTDDSNNLRLKHAKITGQDMRDHWGPIVDRIADSMSQHCPNCETQAADIEKLKRDHAAAVKEANIAKARLKGVQKQWYADRAALKDDK
jgi:hypothetical protein